MGMKTGRPYLIFLIFAVVLQLAGMLLLFDQCGTYVTREITRLTGAVSGITEQELAESENPGSVYEVYEDAGSRDRILLQSIQYYMNLEADKDTNRDKELYLKGKELLTRAGYGYSGELFIKRQISKQLLPVMILLCGGMLTGYGVLLLCLRRSGQVLNELELKYGRAQKELAASRAENSEMFKTFEHFEENLYHQLKTPLTSISLLCHAEENEELQYQISRMSGLIRLFLRDRQLSSGKIRFQFETRALEELVMDAIGRIQLVSRFHHVSIVWELPEEEYLIACDENWLLEAVAAVLENAVNHSEAGASIQAELSARDHMYLLRVISPGKLITADPVDRIFERYYSEKDGHFGIGLHMVREVITMHHGQITAQNLFGENAVCFTLALPALVTDKL